VIEIGEDRPKGLPTGAVGSELIGSVLTERGHIEMACEIETGLQPFGHEFSGYVINRKLRVVHFVMGYVVRDEPGGIEYAQSIVKF
jgi:hypothetical protein